MVGVQGGSHRGLFAMLPIRYALMSMYVRQEAFRGFRSILPTRVTVPGGLAFLTSSFERLNAVLKEVMMVADGYGIEQQMRKRVTMMICDVENVQHSKLLDMVLYSK
jgi:hypothetical protein